ncbi:MAG TPA: acetyl-coenzyme A synthetase N-terminal domain-containing protein, partial [Burkholderiaceae bacterium]|nr:acetyl-coenzyme A synthetase N-terminal domain-containing protein [Burkholderiaceae bacterium]
MSTDPQMLWTPSPLRIERSRMYDYMRWLEREKSLAFDDYHALWQWSVDHLEDFWESIWQYFEVRSSAPYRQVLDAHKMPGAKWFDGARLNFAEQVFRFHHDDGAAEQPAIIAQSELRPLTQLSWRELRQQVTAVAHSLRALGIGPGDRVAAYLPNVPEAAV